MSITMVNRFFGGGGETTEKKDEKEQNNSVFGRRRNAAYARLGCSGCLGRGGGGVFRVDDILEGQKGAQGRWPKMAKFQYGVKPDIFKRAAQKKPNFPVE